MKPLYRNLALTVSVPLIFGAGWWAGGRANSDEAATSEAKSGGPAVSAAPHVSAKAKPQTAPPVISSEIAELLRDGSHTPDRAYATGLKILNSGDTTSRMAALAIWLETMTPETARSMHQAFVDSTANTGRTEGPGWWLLMRRIGAVLGEEAIEAFPSEKDKTLTGWMMADQEKATQWYQSQPPAARQNLEWAWLDGIARQNPQEALTAAMQTQSYSFNPYDLMSTVIQVSGIQSAQEMLQKACDAGEVSPDSPVLRGLFSALTGKLLHQTHTAGHPEQAAAWLEQQKDAPYVSLSQIDNAAYNYASKGDPAEAAAWVSRMGDRGTHGIFRAVQENPELRAKLPAEMQAKLQAAGL